MKKFFVFFLVMALIFSVVGCNKESSSGKMTAKEIMEKTKVNYENVKSMSMEADVDIQSDSEFVPKMEMKMVFDIVSEPFQFKGSIETALGDIEMCVTDDKTYIQDPETKEWMEISSDQVQLPINLDMSNKLISIDEKNVEKLKVSEKDGLYHLTMKGSGEDVVSFMKPFSGMAGNPLNDSFTPKSVKVEYLIDKDKFLIENVNTNAEFEVDGMSDEKINLKFDVQMRMSNLDGIDKIEVPKEVLELQ